MSVHRCLFVTIACLLWAPSARGAAADHADEPRTKYGHHAYQEVAAARLERAGVYPDGRVIRLERDAAAAFLAMKQAATREGIRLVLISGFRSVEYQRGVFERAIKRYGSPIAASRWVAPPGYSQHHTGRALDLGDADDRATDLSPTFKRTRAYQWLSDHAHEFGFRDPFREPIATGPNAEPWHWLYEPILGSAPQ